MKIIAINGSPRKKWNTSTLLENALEGAASQGAETELIHLYDLDYKGCTSCCACKLKDGIKEYAYSVHIGLNENILTRIFGQAESLCCFETRQVEDYNKIVFNYYDPEMRRERPKTAFPEDCRKAFDPGVGLAGTIAADTV